MISLKQIHYALAVERTMHFKKAADLCSVSQSTLSTALSEMEKQLGFQVFERNNKQVLVTPLGQKMLTKAREIKILMEDIEKLEEDPNTPLNTSMSLGIIPTICPFLLPIVLPSLKAHYPDLQLNISEEQSHLLIEQVKQGDLDAAILALPYNCDGLLTFKFWQEDFFWITHINDPLAQLKQIANDQLDPQKLMLLKHGHCLKDHALSACQLSNISNRNLSATSLNTLVQLVANNLGSTLIPAMSVAQLVNHNPNIAVVPLAEKGPHREIAVIIRPNYPSVKKIELLINVFKQALNAQPTFVL